MSIVNVKIKNIRPKYKNLKEWICDLDNVYIGRANIVFIDNQRFPRESSIWANPFKIGKDGTRDEVIKKYEKYIKKNFKKNDVMVQELLDLRGKNLDPNFCQLPFFC
jgi:hypothetical protein